MYGTAKPMLACRRSAAAASAAVPAFPPSCGPATRRVSLSTPDPGKPPVKPPGPDEPPVKPPKPGEPPVHPPGPDKPPVEPPDPDKPPVKPPGPDDPPVMRRSAAAQPLSLAGDAA